jgi:hypothetical protein
LVLAVSTQYFLALPQPVVEVVGVERMLEQLGVLVAVVVLVAAMELVAQGQPTKALAVEMAYGHLTTMPTQAVVAVVAVRELQAQPLKREMVVLVLLRQLQEHH